MGEIIQFPKKKKTPRIIIEREKIDGLMNLYRDANKFRSIESAAAAKGIPLHIPSSFFESQISPEKDKEMEDKTTETLAKYVKRIGLSNPPSTINTNYSTTETLTDWLERRKISMPPPAPRHIRYGGGGDNNRWTDGQHAAAMWLCFAIGIFIGFIIWGHNHG